ncbi:MAG: hypothetical protein Q7S65_04335 [Nanoarchaeota archaeon]|nr:hypothetical protein [Nanoarchaeota archaeon]
MTAPEAEQNAEVAAAEARAMGKLADATKQWGTRVVQETKRFVSEEPRNAARNTRDEVKTAGSDTWKGVKSGAGDVYGAINPPTTPWTSSGLLFVVIALLVNILADLAYPFAGFDLTKYGSVTSLRDLANIADLYFIFKGPLLVLLALVGTFVLNRKHAGLRLFVAIVAVFYIILELPSLAQGYIAVVGLDLIVFLIFCVQMLVHTDREDFTEKMLFWIPVYGLMTMSLRTGNFGAVIHLAFIMVFYLARGATYKKNDSRFRLNFIYLVLFDFFIIWALSFVPTFGFFEWTDIPILLLGTIFIVQAYEPNKLTGWLLFFICVGLVFTFGYGYLTSVAGNGGKLDNVDMDRQSIMERLKIINPVNVFTLLRNSINRSMSIAAGDGYTGSVDANAKKKLGVFIEDVDKNPKKYTTADEIVAFATLTAENLVDPTGMPQEPFDVHMRCFATDIGGKAIPGKIYPRADFRVEQYSVETIECSFQPGDLAVGRYELGFHADFPFLTEAYLKQYFVSKQRVDALRRLRQIIKDEDILKINDISELRPLAQNSAGPIQIKASDRIPAIMKLDNVSTTAFFGLLLESTWQGGMNINSLTLGVPEGVELDKCSLFSAELSTEVFEPGYTFYTLLPGDLEEEPNVFVPCYLTLPLSNSAFLDQGEVTTRYFRMSAYYNYSLEKKLQIRIAEPVTHED